MDNPETRERAVTCLKENLPYSLHVRFLASFVARAYGDRAIANRAYYLPAVAARCMLQSAGIATRAELADLAWDDVLLEAARQITRARRN